jgi:hypothetical protein
MCWARTWRAVLASNWQQGRERRINWRRRGRSSLWTLADICKVLGNKWTFPYRCLLCVWQFTTGCVFKLENYTCHLNIVYTVHHVHITFYYTWRWCQWTPKCIGAVMCDLVYLGWCISVGQSKLILMQCFQELIESHHSYYVVWDTIDIDRSMWMVVWCAYL